MRDLKIIYAAILLSLSGMGAACIFLNAKAWIVLLFSLGSLAPIVAFFFSVGLQALESAPLLDHELPELNPSRAKNLKPSTALLEVPEYRLVRNRKGLGDENEAWLLRAMAFMVKALALTFSNGFNVFQTMPLHLLLSLFGFELSFRGFLLARKRYKQILQFAKEGGN